MDCKSKGVFMKLTTTLLISLGLTFLLGAQAFASNPLAVKIINKDCGKYFAIYADGYSPYSGKVFIVLPKTTSKPIQVPSTVGLFGLPGLGTVAPLYNRYFGSKTVPFGPGDYYVMTFQKKNNACRYSP